MRLLSVPRPNGSAAERAALRALKDWLDVRGIAYQTHGFRHFPFFYQAVGAWLIGSRTLLGLAVLRRWGWPTLPIALGGLAGGLLDTLGLPVVVWPGVRRGESLLLSFGPPDADRELIFAAHYDSKTELLNDRRRWFFLSRLRQGIALTLLLGLLGPLERWAAERRPGAARLLYGLGLLLALPLLVLAWGLGLHLTLGRWARPSQGAVDNGAACAILLGLAARLAAGEGAPRRTLVRIALFGGEEVNMQGSRAFLRERYPAGAPRLPAAAVNLELLGQNGGYQLWQRDGDALRPAPTSPALNAAVGAAVAAVTGQPPRAADLINSDGFAFLSAGIPTSVLGSFDRALGTGGMHTDADNLDRIDITRLPETVEVLARVLAWYDGLPDPEL
jgi:hypothetical protein